MNTLLTIVHSPGLGMFFLGISLILAAVLMGTSEIRKAMLNSEDAR